MRKILVLCNSLIGLMGFRKELLQVLLEKKYKVTVVAPRHEYSKRVKEMGCDYIPISIDSRGTNPIKDLKMMSAFKKVLKTVRPDLVLTYTIKPNVYGGYVCSKYDIPYICNVTGLGTSVEQPGLLQKITLMLYKKGLKKAKCVFFQNEDNLKFMLNHNIVKGKYRLIPGSGVNLKHHTLMEYPNDKILRFLFVSRILREKGIDDYLEVAKYIKGKFDNTEFHILGACEDKNYLEKIDELGKNGIVIYHGQVDDVRDYYKISSCTIHPSFYPEGMSNVLLESCAAGRPIITTNRPGCKEIVDDGVNGYMIECRDIEGLKNKVEKFVRLSNKEREKMGLNGRKKVEKQFDRKIVIDAYLQEIKGVCDEL